ncbi:MAG TPA: hypothetical protein VG407_07045 [Caulobacteraceae bacterium]|jgi:hypothetical protein|nr:hypothetical protein [Caulobacteraceae bacterium]
MEPLKLKLAYVIERGKVVTLLGVDDKTGLQTAVHIDTRPLEQVWSELNSASDGPQRTFEAKDLNVSIDFVPAGMRLHS